MVFRVLLQKGQTQLTSDTDTSSTIRRYRHKLTVFDTLYSGQAIRETRSQEGDVLVTLWMEGLRKGRYVCSYNSDGGSGVYTTGKFLRNGQTMGQPRGGNKK